MRVAIRSFDEPPGLRYSTLTSTVAAMPSAHAVQAHERVLPTRSVTVLAYFMMSPIYQWGAVPALRGRPRVGSPRQGFAPARGSPSAVCRAPLAIRISLQHAERREANTRVS